jgi:hypothetical protein
VVKSKKLATQGVTEFSNSHLPSFLKRFFLSQAMPLSHLPDDILLEVAQYLERKALLALSQVRTTSN